jgi:hypothetical protein
MKNNYLLNLLNKVPFEQSGRYGKGGDVIAFIQCFSHRDSNFGPNYITFPPSSRLGGWP